MVCSRVFVFLATTISLVACLCAHGNGSNVGTQGGTQGTSESIKQLLKRAQKLKSDTQSVVADMGRHRDDAEGAVSEAELTAEENTNAKAVIKEAKSASAKVLELYNTAHTDAHNAIRTMDEILSKYGKLEENAKIGRSSDSGSQNGGDVQRNKEELNTKINIAQKLYDGAASKKNEMEKFVQKAQLAKYNVDAIVAVSKIDDALKAAESDIALIEKKKAEITATVEKLNKIHESTPEAVNFLTHSLYSSAKFYFDSASSAAEEAKETKKTILKYKDAADIALAKVKAASNIQNAEKEASIAQSNANEASRKILKVKNRLDSAKTYATSAYSLREDAVRELKKKGINIITQMKNGDPVNDETEIPARIANVIYVSVQLLLAMIACAASY